MALKLSDEDNDIFVIHVYRVERSVDSCAI